MHSGDAVKSHTPVLLALIVVSLSVPRSSGQPDESFDADAAQRELLLLLQGDDVPVMGTPALCQARGGEEDGRLRDETWYFARGDCHLTYGPSVNAVVTSIMEGVPPQIVESPATRARVLRSLERLERLVTAGTVSLQQRLMIHTLAWEIAHGIKRGHGGRLAEGLEPQLRGALDLLRASHFDVQSAATLPATLADLPRLANVPRIAPIVEGLVRHDPGIVEVLLPSEMHAEFLFGRFTPRLFLTLRTAEGRDRFRQHVAGTRYEELQNLPSAFRGVRAVLILYFNVLTDDFTILPTSQIAFWHQYTFTGAADFSLPFADQAGRIEFLSIHYSRILAGTEESARGPGVGADWLVYREVDQRAMTRQGLLDVKPSREGLWMTTTRGQCLRCHLNRVAAFDTVGKLGVRFSVPLVKGGRELLTPYFLDHVEPELRRWTASSVR
jgi:hypothetical protein